MSWTNSLDRAVTLDKAGPSSMKKPHSGQSKRKGGFHPLRAVKRIFRRKSKQGTKQNEDPNNMAALKSRSTSELLGADDEDGNRSNNGSNHLGSGLSMSHDSVFSPEHNSENDMRIAQSIQNLAMQELMDRLHPQHDSDDDDAGLPHSPCTSPTTAEVLRQGLRETSGKSRSTCSDGSLLSMGSSENDEDSLMSSRHLKLASDRHGDVDSEDGAAFPLSHKAAHHKISVRPKRTHAVGRHRKLQQLTVASLPATPEDIEEMRVVSPDRSWHSVGEREVTGGSSSSVSRASSVMSTSDSTGSLSASASPTRKKVLPTSQEVEASIRARSTITAKPEDGHPHHRRRTFSESPHRDQELKEKDNQSDDARRDKVHSLSTMEGREIHATVLSWGQQETKRTSSPTNIVQRSPIRKERAQSLLKETTQVVETPPCVTDELLRSGSPVRQRLSRGSGSSPSSSPEVARKNEGTAPSKSNGVFIDDNEKAELRRTVQRDPSYRVAVHDSKNWVEVNGNESEKPVKKEESSSSGLFGFGSKKKADAPPKKKEKEEKVKKEEKKVDDSPPKKKEKEEKVKKEEKKVDDSPFFSRFWGSRRSNKKKKDKKDDEDSVNIDADIQEKDEPVVVSEFRRASDFPQEGAVDVKAMVQSITARSTFHATSSFRSKEQEFQDGKPVRPLKPKPLSAKSMESLGPKALDVVPVDLESNPPTKSHFSGSLPKLDSTPLKITHSLSLDTEENSNSGVMLIEGELVRLRKKAFCNEEQKPVKKPATTIVGDQKRNSKRSSILSWYTSKKDSSNPPPDAKSSGTPSMKPIEAPSTGRGFWSSKKSEVEPVKSTPPKPEKTVETVLQMDSKKRESGAKSEIFKTPSKQSVETPKKEISGEKTAKPDVRPQVTPKNVDAALKTAPAGVSKRKTSKEGPPGEKFTPQVTVEPKYNDKQTEIMTLDASPKNMRKMKDDDKVEENGSEDGKLVRGSVSNGDGESELMKVFHRRSLKIKDKEKKEVPVEPEKIVQPSSPVKATPEVNLGDGESSREMLMTKGGATSRKMSKSLYSEPVTASENRACTSPTSAMATSNIEIVSKNGDKVENGTTNMPEWRRIAQQRREQREMREKQHVTGNGHADSSILMQATPKHSGRSKVLDMVSNFQKLQVS